MHLISTPLHDAFSPYALSFVFAAMGLNIHYGYTGLLNFGQSGFLAVAAYGMAVTVQSFDLSLWLGIVIGLAGAVLLALLLAGAVRRAGARPLNVGEMQCAR